jgi:hypothetical protein
MVSIFAGFVLGTLGAWFLLPRVFAEVILTLLILAAAAIGIYCVCAGSSVNEIAESIGIFTLLNIVLGSIRVGVEKVSDKYKRTPSESNGNSSIAGDQRRLRHDS